uniref:Uncharacterized protein n=1 Tax=Oryza glumipatula TaxID=40148 RepID=A0A0D9ZRA1_9ORYZ
MGLGHRCSRWSEAAECASTPVRCSAAARRSHRSRGHRDRGGAESRTSWGWFVRHCDGSGTPRGGGGFAALQPRRGTASGCGNGSASAYFPIPGSENTCLTEWWLQARTYFRKCYRTNFDSACMLICWQIWKERNARVFDQRSRSPNQLAEAIKEEILFAGLWFLPQSNSTPVVASENYLYFDFIPPNLNKIWSPVPSADPAKRGTASADALLGKRRRRSRRRRLRGNRSRRATSGRDVVSPRRFRFRRAISTPLECRIIESTKSSAFPSFHKLQA